MGVPSNVTGSMTGYNSTTVAMTVVQENDVITQLQIVMDIMVISLTAILMLSFGCSIKLQDIQYHVKRPVSVSIAMVCQFILVPYVFYGVHKAVILNEYDSASLMILSTCPAGGVANLYVNWAEGDIALGIIITAVSTLSGLVFMPLNFWMFGDADQSQSLPYIETIVSTISTLVPVAIGMILLQKAPRLATGLSRVGSVLGGILVLGTIGLSSYMYPAMYQSDWKTWLIASVYSPISYLIGYLLTLAMRMPEQVRRTIGITTSVKSIALCLTIIAVSFSVDTYHLVLVFPELHSIMMLIQLGLICLMYRITRCCKGKYFMGVELGGEPLETDSVVETAGVINQTISETDDIITVTDRNRHVTRRMSDVHALQNVIALSLFSNNV